MIRMIHWYPVHQDQVLIICTSSNMNTAYSISSRMYTWYKISSTIQITRTTKVNMALQFFKCDSFSRRDEGAVLIISSPRIDNHFRQKSIRMKLEGNNFILLK